MSFKLCSLFLILFLTPLTAQTSSSRIMEVGYGVFAIGFGTVVAVVICLLGRATRYPEFFFLFSLLIPIFLIFFFLFAPKEIERAQNEQAEFQTDGYITARYIYLVIFLITFCLTGFLTCKLGYFVSLFAVRVGTVNQEDKDNFFDNEGQIQKEEQQKEEQKNVDFPKNLQEGDINQPIVKSENTSFVGEKNVPKGIFKRKKPIEGQDN